MGAHAKNRCKGFTLLEVLVSMAILALAFGVILQILGDSARKVSRTDEYRQALMIAESQLAMATAIRDPRTVPLSGSIDDKYHWSVSFEPTTEYDVAAVRNLYAPLITTVTVQWDSAGARRTGVELSTVRLAGSSMR